MVRVLSTVLLSVLLFNLAFADSIPDLEKAVARHPEDLALRKRLAAAYYEAGQLEACIEQLQQVLHMQPDDQEAVNDLLAAYRLFSMQRLNQGDFSEAIQAADAFIALAQRTHQDPLPGRFLRIAILIRQGTLDMAQEALTSLPATSTLTQNAQDLLVAARLRQAQGAVKRKDYAAALEQIRKAAQVNPEKYAYLHLQTVQILIGTGKRSEALAVLDPLSRTLPRDNPHFMYRLGVLYDRLGQYERSRSFLQLIPPNSEYAAQAQALIARQGHIADLALEVRKALTRGDTPKAIEVLRQVLQMAPEHPRWRFHLAKLLASQNRSQEALAQLELLRAEPQVAHDPTYQLAMGQLYVELGEVDWGRRLLNQIPPDDEHFEEAQRLLKELSPSETPPSEASSSEASPSEASQPIAPSNRSSLPEHSLAPSLEWVRTEATTLGEVGAISQEAPESAEPSPPVNPIERRIRDLASRYRLELRLALALMKQESNLDPLAVSRVGAAGLCQIMPATGRELGLKIPQYPDPRRPTRDGRVDERFDPYKAMEAGFRYLRQLLDRYENNVPLALSAYNAGMGRTGRRVARLYETTAYVADIMTYYWRYEDEEMLRQALDQLVQNIERLER